MMLGLMAATLLARPLLYTGTNLSGAEFGSHKGRIFGKTYTYPSEGEVAYFTERGMNVFRIPFLWESMQPTLKGDLDANELARLTGLVRAITKRGAVAILDPHNYASRGGETIGGSKVSNADFADFWGRLAARFKDDSRVWFGLVNEPHDLPTAQWLGSSNAAFAAIRKAGAKNLVLVPGNGWTGAHTWIESGNDLMLGIKDPVDRYVYEVHQYLDEDSSGSHGTVVSPTIGSERLKGFVAWCRKHHKRGFLGEFGVASNEATRGALEDMLTAMERERDVWLGFTWWSAGPWWGDYMFTIEPKDGKDRPQFETLRPHLQKPKSAR